MLKLIIKIMFSEKIGLYYLLLLNGGIMTFAILMTLLFMSLFSMASDIDAEAVNRDLTENTLDNQRTVLGNSAMITYTALEATQYSDNNTIQLMVIEETDRLYRWLDADSNDINPTLRLVADVNNIIKLQNPTEERHELIILGSHGNQFAAGENIEPKELGQLSMRPNMALDTPMEYYCKYHPETMKGTIQIESKMNT